MTTDGLTRDELAAEVDRLNGIIAKQQPERHGQINESARMFQYTRTVKRLRLAAHNAREIPAALARGEVCLVNGLQEDFDEAKVALARAFAPLTAVQVLDALTVGSLDDMMQPNLAHWQLTRSNHLGWPESVSMFGQFDLVTHIKRQQAFSRRTFGEGYRAETVIAHIRKELDEVAANPSDLVEWIDLILLAIDGAWRQGFKAERIAGALFDKQRKNELRNWPDPSTVPDGAPIEHVRVVNEGSHVHVDANYRVDKIVAHIIKELDEVVEHVRKPGDPE